MSAFWGACSVLILKQGRFAIERVSTAFANLLRHWMHGSAVSLDVLVARWLAILFQKFSRIELSGKSMFPYCHFLQFPLFQFVASRPTRTMKNWKNSRTLEQRRSIKSQNWMLPPKSAAPKPVAAPVPKEATLHSHKITMLSRSQNFVHKLEKLISHLRVTLITAIQVIHH